MSVELKISACKCINFGSFVANPYPSKPLKECNFVQNHFTYRRRCGYKQQDVGILPHTILAQTQTEISLLVWAPDNLSPLDQALVQCSLSEWDLFTTPFWCIKHLRIGRVALLIRAN